MQVLRQTGVDFGGEGFRVDGFGQMVIESGRQCPVAVADHRERGHRDDRDGSDLGR
jgi:hypothetical protein